ncbi:MAG: hypothetical protein D6736_11320 [Nitrospinota bacterium]|nr:MAG: hypothetical protein D6736_11320 [Nitrospinota bacterium]
MSLSSPSSCSSLSRFISGGSGKMARSKGRSKSKTRKKAPFPLPPERDGQEERDLEAVLSPGNRDPDEEEIPTYPHLVYIELIAALGVIALLLFLALWIDAPLEEQADPSWTPNPAKAPWYFVGLQELLTYFDPWLGGVMIPLLFLLGLLLLPYVDVNRAGAGEYSFRQRPLATTAFTVGLLLWFGLILVGAFLRGPNWQIYWPGESWDVEKPFTDPAWSLPPAVGLPLLLGYLALGYLLPRLLWPDGYRRLGLMRYLVIVSLFLLLGGVLLKIGLHVLFGLKYIVQTPWINI